MVKQGMWIVDLKKICDITIDLKYTNEICLLSCFDMFKPYLWVFFIWPTHLIKLSILIRLLVEDGIGVTLITLRHMCIRKTFSRSDLCALNIKDVDWSEVTDSGHIYTRARYYNLIKCSSYKEYQLCIRLVFKNSAY